DWSMPGSTGIVAPAGAFKLTFTGPTLKFNSFSTGDIVSRYRVTNVYGSGTSKTPPWTTLTGAFLDNSANGSVTVKLIEVDQCTGDETTICTISSSDNAAIQCQTCSYSSSTFDFSTNTYYVEVTLSRSATSAGEELHSVAVN
ncbi:MAG TPA: hypothetical protein VMU84_00005, partial [Thermoanaerobaculia bacterium]|nr:hypothetical protein [Thermoanaerobaculia bacterium]